MSYLLYSLHELFLQENYHLFRKGTPDFKPTVFGQGDSSNSIESEWQKNTTIRNSGHDSFQLNGTQNINSRAALKYR
jgi:hypothetical protein